MKIFVNILYMYGLAAIISFFVAFLNQSMFSIIKIFEKRKAKLPETGEIPTIELSNVQKEANVFVTGEETYAAISLALHLYFKEAHDNEDLRITIQKSMKPYSPWSSKIYAVTPWRR
jgi:glutaconyl-CoA/methylmalonyl-CoA decarboxylase subunit delta